MAVLRVFSQSSLTPSDPPSQPDPVAIQEVFLLLLDAKLWWDGGRGPVDENRMVKLDRVIPSRTLQNVFCRIYYTNNSNQINKSVF